jgi:hypothetical protein
VDRPVRCAKVLRMASCKSFARAGLDGGLSCLVRNSPARMSERANVCIGGS